MVEACDLGDLETRQFPVGREALPATRGKTFLSCMRNHEALITGSVPRTYTYSFVVSAVGSALGQCARETA